MINLRRAFKMTNMASVCAGKYVRFYSSGTVSAPEKTEEEELT